MNAFPDCTGFVQIAAKVGVDTNRVKNVIIWGNHSSTQFPDVSHGYVVKEDGQQVPITETVNDDAWLKGDFITVGSK